MPNRSQTSRRHTHLKIDICREYSNQNQILIPPYGIIFPIWEQNLLAKLLESSLKFKCKNTTLQTMEIKLYHEDIPSICTKFKFLKSFTFVLFKFRIINFLWNEESGP